MGKNRHHDNFVKITNIEKLGIILAMLSIAERVIIMLMFEG